MTYKLLFSPELSIPGNPKSDILLTPVIVDEKGGSFAMRKAVKTVRQAFMFDAGFTLAQFIEEEGGVEGVQAMIAARGAEEVGADVLTQQEEDDLLDALDGGPLGDDG